MTDRSWLEFSRLKQAPGLVHRVFSREGGISKGAWESLNVGLSTGDDPKTVWENRQRVTACFGGAKAVWLNQVHGTDLVVLKQSCDADFGISDLPPADGVVTDIPGLALMIQVADCQAVLVYDPEKNVVANVHSGWRGSIGNIIGRCVDLMAAEFGSDPRDLLAGISPSLGPCCAEFIHYRTEIPEPLWRYRRDGRDYFDFWALSRDQLLEKGVREKHIENMAICTRCNTGRFFSYRAGHITGRFAVGAALVRR